MCNIKVATPHGLNTEEMNNVLPNLDVGKEGTLTLAVSHIQAVQVPPPHGLDAKNAKKGMKVLKNVQNSVSHIQISYTLVYMLGMLVKPFIAVLMLYSK